MTYDSIKRYLDLCIAIVLLIITSPLFLIISFAIKVADGGSVFYLQKRVGQSHKSFRIIKFRSMHEGSEELRQSLTSEQYDQFIREYKLEEDPRTTKVGAFLRASKLDELPQLVNVVGGQMSMVGPRPITSDELRYYTALEEKRLLTVRPGLTGLWQVNDRNDITYESGRRQAIELLYVDRRTLLLDITIMLKTIVIIISKAALFVLHIKSTRKNDILS